MIKTNSMMGSFQLCKVHYTIKIIDSGPGISKEGLNSLFQNFGMLDENRSQNTKGTGLGLSICKQLIKLMRGKISVDSQLGKGTTFTLDFISFSKLNFESFVQDESSQNENLMGT